MKAEELFNTPSRMELCNFCESMVSQVIQGASRDNGEFLLRDIPVKIYDRNLLASVNISVDTKSINLVLDDGESFFKVITINNKGQIIPQRKGMIKENFNLSLSDEAAALEAIRQIKLHPDPSAN